MHKSFYKSWRVTQDLSKYHSLCAAPFFICLTSILQIRPFGKWSLLNGQDGIPRPQSNPQILQKRFHLRHNGEKGVGGGFAEANFGGGRWWGGVGGLAGEGGKWILLSTSHWTEFIGGYRIHYCSDPKINYDDTLCHSEMQKEFFTPQVEHSVQSLSLIAILMRVWLST